MTGPITWGVEFEFAFPDAFHGRGNQATREFPDQASLRALALYMHNQLDIPVAAGCMCDNEDTLSLFCSATSDNLHMDGSMALFRAPPRERPFKVSREALFFFLSTDAVVDQDADSNWEGLEISSPARGLNELQRGMPEVRGLIRGLSHWNAGIALTDYCGLHIHVGTQSGLTLELVKRVFTLGILLEEELLIRLVSPDRQENKFFTPLTHTSRMAQYAKSKPSNDSPVCTGILPPGHENGRFWSISGHLVGHVLVTLWQAPDLDTLTSGLYSPLPGIKSSLYLALRSRSDSSLAASSGSDDSADDGWCPARCSIEFRYPQMTFDADYIQMWVEMATRIMEVAEQTEDSTYQRVVSNILQVLDRVEEENIIPGLLRALVFDQATIVRWGRLVTRHEGDDPSLEGTGPYRKLRNNL